MEVVVVGEVYAADDHGSPGAPLGQPVVSQQAIEVEHAPLDLKRLAGVHLGVRQHTTIHRSQARTGIGIERPFGKVDLTSEELVEGPEVLEVAESLVDPYVVGLHKARDLARAPPLVMPPTVGPGKPPSAEHQAQGE